MGKRSLHSATYHVCDYTGFAMRDACCYMPTWRNGRLQKKGCYCNWETVLRHAQELCVTGAMTVQEWADVIKHVHKATGTDDVVASPEYKGIVHFGGHIDAAEFHRACCFATKPIEAVVLCADGRKAQLLLMPESGEFRELRDATLYAKEKLCAATRFAGVQLNSAATQLLKREVCGDVLVARFSNEHSFLPRTRYTSFTLHEYEALLMRTKQRVHATPLSDEEYAALRKEMEASIKRFEQHVTKDVVQPQALAGAAVMPPTTGAALAEIAEMRGLGSAEEMQASLKLKKLSARVHG